MKLFDDNASEFNEQCFSSIVRSRIDREAKTVASEFRLNKLYKRCVKTAIAITLTFGTFWGVSILTKAAVNHSFTAPAPAEIQAHAHAQIFGWIGLLVMGVLYFAYPRFLKAPIRNAARAEASFWFMASGIVIRAIAQPFADHVTGGIAVVISSLAELIAGCLFVSVIYGVYRRAAEKSAVSDMFIFSSLGWLMVALYLNFVSMLIILRTGDPAISPDLNLSRMNAEVFGFIISMILGMAARLLPRLMNCRMITRQSGLFAVFLFGAGVFAKVIAAPPVIGSALVVAAVVVYVLALDVFNFTARSINRHEPLRIWVRTSFFWLTVGGATMLGGDLFAALGMGEVPHVWVGSYRHAVAVGFITTMALGIAHRTVPVFHGAPLYSTRLMWAAFALLQIGNTSRVIFQVFTSTKLPIIYAITGMSGYFELMALILFGCNIVLTFRRPSSEFLKELVVRKTTVIGDFCSVFPGAKNELAELGLLCGKGSHLSPSMTVKTASKVSGVSAELAVERLNRYAMLSQKKPVTLSTLF